MPPHRPQKRGHARRAGQPYRDAGQGQPPRNRAAPPVGRAGYLRIGRPRLLACRIGGRGRAVFARGGLAGGGPAVSEAAAVRGGGPGAACHPRPGARAAGRAKRSGRAGEILSDWRKDPLWRDNPAVKPYLHCPVRSWMAAVLCLIGELGDKSKVGKATHTARSCGWPKRA